MNGVIEQIERGKSILVLIFDFLCSFLEAGKHGTLTTGEVFTCVTVFADLREYFLHQDELIRNKREVPGEILCCFKAPDIQKSVILIELQKVPKNGIILVKDILQ